MIVGDKLIGPYMTPFGLAGHYGPPILLTAAIVILGFLTEKKRKAAAGNETAEVAAARH
jgi:hypothetical protein